MDEWSSDLSGSDFNSELQAAQSKAKTDGVNATPTLVVSGPNGQKKIVGPENYAQVADAIDQVDGS